MDFTLAKIHTNNNGLYILTKVMFMDKLNACQKRVGVLKLPHLGVKGEFVGILVLPNGMN